MVQKMSIKEMNLTICGTGRIDETQPIDLAEYTVGYAPCRNAQVPMMAVPQRVRFSRTIADTVYDVTGSFDMEGKQTLLQQMKELLLKHSMEEPQN